MQTEGWNIQSKDFPKSGKFEEKVRFLLNYAILAPSGHNSQPWKFEIGTNKIVIMPDYERGRNIVDSDNRELFVSLGAVAKNLDLAAIYFRMSHKIHMVDDKIWVVFDSAKVDKTDSGLFEAIAQRSTYREEYLKKKTDQKTKDVLAKIKSEKSRILLYDQELIVEMIADMAMKADLVWYKSRHLIRELEEWLRDDVEEAKDGLPTGMINMYKIAAEAKYLFSQDSREAKRKSGEDKKITLSTSMVAMVVSNENNIENWVDAGMVFEELILAARSVGLTNGIIGSLTELKGVKKELATKLGIEGWIQMVLTIGYPKIEVPNTPRRPLDEMLV